MLCRTVVAWYRDVMDAEINESTERRQTTVRLPVAQLRWINGQAFDRKVSQQAIIETAVAELWAAERRGDPIDWLSGR